MVPKVPLAPASLRWSFSALRASRSAPRGGGPCGGPRNAVSLVGRAAGALSPGRTCKLIRALRKHALNYLDQLWMLTSDWRHKKDTTVLMTELKADRGAMSRRCWG